MAYDFRDADHLPKRRGDAGPVNPYDLPRQRSGVTPQMHGRYPDHDVLAQRDHWDAVTRETLTKRVNEPPPIRFFSAPEAETLSAFCDTVMAQDGEPKIPVLGYVDAKMFDADEKGLDGYRYADMPDDRETWRLTARALDEEARSRGHASFHEAPKDAREEVVGAFADGGVSGGAWEKIPRAWSVVMRSVLGAFYGHPWAWNEIGYGGPAYPRGFMRLKTDQKEPWEGKEASETDPVPDLQKTNGSGNGRDPEAEWRLKEGARRAARISADTRARDGSFADRKTSLKRP